ncbi:sugar transferase [Chitinophaga sp. 22620]|uniref:sugar transferase n=1 Tax=Chitinophaga sp. 22620 TaxID=3453952 RepID=UPI003F83BFA2
MMSILTVPVPDSLKTEPRIINLSRSATQSYILCIGSNAFLHEVAGKCEERMLVAQNHQAARIILMEQLMLDLKPAFVICNLSAGTDPRSYLSLVRSFSELQDTPFFVYVDTLDAKKKQELRSMGGIDQVFTAGFDAEAFLSSVKAAKRIKELAKSSRQKEVHSVNLGRMLNYCLKRTLDISIAATGLLVASPVLLTIAALIKLESRGPVFYISKRAGQGYRIFKFYKFRTMVAEADKQVSQMSHLNQYDANGTGPVFFKVSNDPRVTRLGAILRNTSLDEIPQLLNVILGDMSLVGNRPLPLYEAASLTTDSYAGRFLAPAGLTGLWQIKKRGSKEMSVDERIRLDIEYAEKHSVMYDMWILANTPTALLQKDNV